MLYSLHWEVSNLKSREASWKCAKSKHSVTTLLLHFLLTELCGLVTNFWMVRNICNKSTDPLMYHQSLILNWYLKEINSTANPCILYYISLNPLPIVISSTHTLSTSSAYSNRYSSHPPTTLPPFRVPTFRIDNTDLVLLSWSAYMVYTLHKLLFLFMFLIVWCDYLKLGFFSALDGTITYWN